LIKTFENTINDKCVMNKGTLISHYTCVFAI